MNDISVIYNQSLQVDRLVNNWDDIFFNIGEFKTTNGIQFKNHTLREIVKFGQENYFRVLNLFTMTPYDLRVQLYDNGIDYVDVSDYDIFIMLWNSDMQECLSNENHKSYSELLKFFISDDLVRMCVGADFVSKSFIVKNDDFEINPFIYMQVSNYFKKIQIRKNNIEWKNLKGKKAREMDIRIEKDRLEIEGRRGNIAEYPIKKYASSLVWGSHSGNDYEKILNLNIWQLYDAVERIGKKENAENLNYGIYSGSVDYSKIDKSILNWID